MSGDEKQGAGKTDLGLAVIGAGALVVVCCAALPLIAVFVGSLAVGLAVGAGAGVVALIALLAFVLLRASRRAAHSRSCGPSTSLRR